MNPASPPAIAPGGPAMTPPRIGSRVAPAAAMSVMVRFNTVPVPRALLRSGFDPSPISRLFATPSQLRVS